MGKASPIGVMIVDDLDLFRAGLTYILRSAPNLKKVGEAKNGLEAIKRYETLKPDVVLMDAQMPGMDGYQATKEILRIDPSARIVILTTDMGEHTIVKAISTGALGYIAKNATPAAVIDGIEKAFRGEYVVPNEVTVFVVQRLLRSYTEPTNFTPREMDILRWLTTGATNKQLGQALGISPSTVGNYIQRLLKKLGLENRAQLAAYAVRQGFQVEESTTGLSHSPR
ncbi:MAG: response regulator transcription factor [Alicyclobacillus herbarius]|uniref:response regulator n=1 Tax=Alicyclobacillus herbarius TaxID=122960 RepID=UPI00040ECDE9|nr:response regulator transcription factor [Alicyclobacillus herbarius]MCL6631977.1 response regulator transcription factor [Alicyclobacillus herbarius]